MIIVDSSVLITFFRFGRTKNREAAALARCEEAGVAFFIPCFCLQELLQGAKDQHEWSRLHRYLGSQNILEPGSGASYVEAARIYFDARRKGLTIRSTIDALIAQICLEQDGYLLHCDQDFGRIKKVRPKLKIFEP